MSDTDNFAPREITDRDKRRVVIYGRTHGKDCSTCAHLRYDKHARAYPRCICPQYTESVHKKHWRTCTEACRFYQEVVK